MREEAGPEKRVVSTLNLRIWGIDTEGRVFSQAAHACNISARGALLSGITCGLKIGDTIGLQYGEKKVRCKVVWTLNTGSVQKIQAGVELLSEMACPWAAELDKLASTVGQRQWKRHKISFLIELHKHGGMTPELSVTATDISANGCYVETSAPLPVGTILSVNLRIAAENITSRAIVRTSDPGLGMGIAFVGLKAEDQQRFQAHLEALDPWSCSIAR